MGEPILEAEKIPVYIDEKMKAEGITPTSVIKNLKLEAYNKNFTFTCVSMGNPHAITFIENVEKFDVKNLEVYLNLQNRFQISQTLNL